MCSHLARSSITRFSVWRTFAKQFCSASRISEDSFFDEAEVRQKFKFLGSGDLTLTKLTGGQEGTAVISLVNPERKNALTGYMMVRLAEAVDELEQWEHGKTLILHGCEGSFCSGADLSIVKTINTPREGNLMCAFMQRTLSRLESLPLISVAAVEGRALGGGAEVSGSSILGLVKSWSQDWLIAARAYPGFCGTKRLGVFLLPLDGMLVHRRSLPRNLLGFPNNRPFARSGHMAQNKLHRDANYAVGLSKQRKVGLDWYEFLCFGNPTA